MEINYLKETLFDEFDRFDDYECIISDLRSLNSLNELSNDEYDTIMQNYDLWLKEWEENGKN